VRIMVVDDEVLVRVGVKTIVEWERHGHQIVAEAENGARALELLDRCAPDIALVDIRMPVMDGLELITRARAQGTRCKFIILSCLNEFRYAQEALKLGVRDYVIKTSMDSADLLRLINGVAAEIEEERKGTLLAGPVEAPAEKPALAELREALRCGGVAPRELLALLARAEPLLVPSRLYALSLRIAHFEAVRKRLEGGHDRTYSRGVLNVCGELFRQHGAGIIFEEDERCFTAFVALRRGSGDPDLADLCRRITDTARTLLGFELAVGASRAIADDPLQGHRQSVRAREGLFLGTGSYRQAPGPEAGVEGRDSLEREVKGLRDAMFRCVGDLNLEAAREILERIRSALAAGEGRVDPADARQTYLDVLYWLSTQVKKDMMDVCEEYGEFHDVFAGMQACESLGEIHSHLSTFMSNLSHIMSDREGAKTRLLVEKAREHIEANLAEDLSLEETARCVGLSPGYFGKLFKRETGTSFTEFLIRSRIERAKQLMKGDEKMWAISLQIGYPDLSSFSRSFKRVTGITPSQFKDRLTGSAAGEGLRDGEA
jgi:two-component system, response regulator YesN